LESSRNTKSFLTINKFNFNFSLENNEIISAEPAQGNEKCPRRNGYFAHPDPTICNVFYNCIDGAPIENQCPSGLIFDEYAGICAWPKEADKANCGANKGKSIYKTSGS